jgi:hypothetical protein
VGCLTRELGRRLGEENHASGNDVIRCDMMIGVLLIFMAAACLPTGPGTTDSNNAAGVAHDEI